MIEGIYLLMHSDLEGAVNIGCPQYVSVDELVATVAGVAASASTSARGRAGGRAIPQHQQRAHLLAGLAGEILPEGRHCPDVPLD
jgi:NAD dependent epimerase/dehydratase family enzyme